MSGKPGKKPKQQFTAWIGFSGGKPHFYLTNDGYGTVALCELYRSQLSAKPRYQDVRKVTVTVSKSGKRGQ